MVTHTGHFPLLLPLFPSPVPSMPNEQPTNVTEVSDGEVSSQRCLLPFLESSQRKGDIKE